MAGSILEAHKILGEHGPMGYIGKDMMRTIMKLIIMGRIKKSGRIYPYALIKEIRGIKHPMIRGNPQIKNEVYNTLKALEQAGYVKAAVSGNKAPVKVYYTLTKKGDSTLNETRRLVRETAKSIVKMLG